MNRNTLIIITLVVVSVGLIFLVSSKIRNKGATGGETVKNSEIRDGIQYITINAKGGYLPKVSTAKAGIPTKLIVQTNGTYDCSASLVIRSVGFQQILPQTGETVIDLGVPKAGEPVRGVCGMGMYSFEVRFSS